MLYSKIQTIWTAINLENTKCSLIEFSVYNFKEQENAGIVNFLNI